MSIYCLVRNDSAMKYHEKFMVNAACLTDSKAFSGRSGVYRIGKWRRGGVNVGVGVNGSDATWLLTGDKMFVY